MKSPTKLDIRTRSLAIPNSYSVTSTRPSNAVQCPFWQRRYNVAFLIRKASLTQTHGDYPDAVRKLAARSAVPLLDMTQRSHELLVKLGKDRSQRLFNSSQPGEYERHPKGHSRQHALQPLVPRVCATLAVAEMQRHVPGLAVHLKTP